jgi:hypothetical protein
VADLAEATSDAGLPLDDGPGLLGGTSRILGEEFLARSPVLGQCGSGLMPAAASQPGKAAFTVLVEA